MVIHFVGKLAGGKSTEAVVIRFIALCSELCLHWAQPELVACLIVSLELVRLHTFLGFFRTTHMHSCTNGRTGESHRTSIAFAVIPLQQLMTW